MEELYEWAAALDPGHTHYWRGPENVARYLMFGDRRRCAICDEWEPVEGIPTPRTLEEAHAQRYLVPTPSSRL